MGNNVNKKEQAAIKKVKNPLPVPETCIYCEAPVAYINNQAIYGKSYGYWPYAYSCTKCDSYVGVHPNTTIPLGTLANAKTRAARKKAKEPFLTWIRNKGISRNDAYKMLSEKMGIPHNECHFAWFTVELCEKAEQAARELFLGAAWK
jgi:hypothetical protein